MSSLKKRILVFGTELFEKCKNIFGEQNYEFFFEADEQEKADYTFISSWQEQGQVEGKGILVDSCPQLKSAFEANITAVIHPSQFDHEVGQVALKRLLGENSSLGMESVFHKSNIQFKNFRLMDHMMMGHYSDVLAREAYLKGHKHLPIRNFFDSVASFLFHFEQERRVSFPYDVDFGLWNDLFVMQIHCSSEGVTLEDMTASLGDYKIENPQAGLLKLALSQTDSLDIYQLQASKRLVICAQWFHPLRKKQFNSFYPSLYLHQIEKYSPYQGVVAKTLLSPLSETKLRNFEEDIFEKVVHKLNQIDVEGLTRLVGGDDNSDEGHSKVKAWLGVEDEQLQRVSGAIEEDDSFQRVSGKIEEDDSRQVIAGNPQEQIEQAWRIKKDEIIDNLKNKFVVKGDQSLSSELEIQNVLQEVFHSDEKQLSLMAKQLISGPDDLDAEAPKQRWDFEAKRAEQDLIKKDAQILRMKKLIDRMKTEIQGRNTVAEINNTQELTQGLTAAMAESESKRLTQDLKKQQTLHEKSKALLEQQLKVKEEAITSLEEKLDEAIENKHQLQMNSNEATDLANLENQNESLRNQLEISKKRISQMSETILNNSRSHKEKENKELSAMKEAMGKAQEAIKKFQSELEVAKRELKDKEAENKSLMKHFNNVQAEEEVVGPTAEQVELEEALNEIEKTKNEIRALTETQKSQHLEIKKLEQKNRFLTAQLESAQKKGPVVANNTQGGSMNDAQAGKKVKQLEKVVEAMKDNEQKLQQELISKKDDLQKMKAETMSLKNKVGELERKLQKYEKEAA